MPNRIRIAAACVALAPVAASAADSFYVTAAGGYSWAQTSKLSASHGDGFSFQASSGNSEKHGAWRAGAGWYVLPRVALELAYADYGKQSFSVLGTANGSFVTQGLTMSSAALRRESEREVSAVTLDMVGHWPVHEHVTLVGRVGPAFGLVKASSAIATHLGLEQASVESRVRSFAFHASGAVRWSDVLPSVDLEAALDYLGPVGTSFSADNLDGTGRSSQTTLWLGIVKRF